ncbi:MAG: hypothetical protein SW833_04255 [Cyanobacteriota bacterium]|nr:hypothetical protein [Cyanobacteriota bacterium]
MQLLELAPLLSSTPLDSLKKGTELPAAYGEVLDFLLKRPTPTEIVSFKVSPQAQHRLQTLLAKNREVTLIAEEFAELDLYEQLEHLMILLKACAYNRLI